MIGPGNGAWPQSSPDDPGRQKRLVAEGLAIGSSSACQSDDEANARAPRGEDDRR